MDALPLIAKFRAKIVCVMFQVLFCIVLFSGNAHGFYEKKGLNIEAYSMAELKAVIDEYRIQAKVINKQIQDVEKDLDWLVLKINRISDSGRKIPAQLKHSVALKEKKAVQLGKQKNRLETLVLGYEKAYAAKAEKMAPKKISNIKVNPIAAATTKVPDASMTQGKISDIELAVKKAGLEDWVEVLNADGGCAKINNTLPILFSSGSAVLAKEYQSFLKKLAYFLKSYDVKIYVNGFADPDPIHTPKYPSNLELGASRAANLVHEMVKYGLKPDIFKIGTTGEYRFAAKEPSQNKSFQRRAQLTVVFSG